MLKLRVLLFVVLLVSGCASAPIIIEGNGELERAYASSYKKVFYAADVAANGIGEFVQFYTKETNFDKGFIKLNGGAPAVRVVVNVEKIDNNKTVVRIKKYSKNVAEYLGANFFQNLERLLNNK